MCCDAVATHVGNGGHGMKHVTVLRLFLFSHKRFIKRTGRLVEIDLLPTDELWDNMMNYCRRIDGPICDNVYFVTVCVL